MPIYLGKNCFSAALDRLMELYEAGHRIIITISGGKDSSACMELAIMAAERTGNLPVETLFMDDEILLPGTIEYLTRVYHRPEVNMHWIIAGQQPEANIFNRENPYWWAFDDRLTPSEWVREPPPWAEHIDTIGVDAMITVGKYPPPEGKKLLKVIGLRANESLRRRAVMYSAKGHITKSKWFGAHKVFPIYDWGTGDVWKAHKDCGWDYNTAYDKLYQLGVPLQNCRITPPTMSVASLQYMMPKAAAAWPKWFNKVCTRLPGIRSAVRYGKRVLEPHKQSTETWQECFQRECIDNAPQWIAARAQEIKDKTLRIHHHHSTQPLPEVKSCPQCSNAAYASWKSLALKMYNGDPFCLCFKDLKWMEPEFFRPNAGKWTAKPTW